jgi:hypothetical protein
MVFNGTLRGVLSAGLTACLLAACGGGGGGGGVSPAGSGGGNGIAAPAATATPAASAGTLSITIVVPANTTTSATTRTPKYVSPSTQSVSISLSGGTTPLAVANLSASTPGCTAVTAGLSCTLTATAPAGNDTFVVTAYDGTNGTGNRLSTASVASAVTANATTRLPLTLNGIVATVVVTLGSTSPVAAGVAASVSVIVTAFDSSQHMIVGPGTFDTPVTLSDNDPTTATMLAGAPGTAPAKTIQVAAPGTSVTLNYSGNSMGSATITPSVGSTVGTPATFTPYGASVATYSSGGVSDAQAIARGPNGDVWMGGYDGSFADFAANGRFSHSGDAPGNFKTMTAGSGSYAIVYGSDHNGIFTFGGIDTSGSAHAGTTQESPPTCIVAQGSQTCGYISGMATTPDGNVWFSDNDGYIGVVTPLLQLYEYDPSTLSGWTEPGGVTTNPTSIAVGPDGALYVGDNYSTVERFVISGTMISSVTAVNNQSSCIDAVNALTTGPDGKIWFADSCGNIGVVPTGASFTQANVMAWSVPQFGFSLSSLTANGNLLVGSNYGSVVYALDITGVTATVGPNVAEIPVIGNNTSNYSQITAIATGGDNNVWASISEDCGDSSALAKVIIGGAGVYQPASSIRASSTLSHRILPRGHIRLRKHAR